MPITYRPQQIGLNRPGSTDPRNRTAAGGYTRVGTQFQPIGARAAPTRRAPAVPALPDIGIGGGTGQALPTPEPTTAVPSTPPVMGAPPSPAMAGLRAAGEGTAILPSGQAQLRQGLGYRNPPSLAVVLAGLRY